MPAHPHPVWLHTYTHYVIVHACVHVCVVHELLMGPGVEPIWRLLPQFTKQHSCVWSELVNRSRLCRRELPLNHASTESYTIGRADSGFQLTWRQNQKLNNPPTPPLSCNKHRYSPAPYLSPRPPPPPPDPQRDDDKRWPPKQAKIKTLLSTL